MKLYHSPTSPYVRKVMVLLHEAGMLDRVELMPTTSHPVDGSTMPPGRNPLAKVPALDRDDGPTLYDSRVITRYLDAAAGAGLYPEPPRLWEVLTLEATADGILDAAILMVYESKARPAEKLHAPWVEGQWGKVARALDAIETRWLSHLHARRLDMGQIAIGCALGYVDLRHGARNWREGRDGLAAWYESFAQRPSMAATVPPG